MKDRFDFTMVPTLRTSWRAGLCALAATTALIACGGGGSDSASSGTGTGGTGSTATAAATGLVQGTVSGFGSVIVDATEIEDAQASTVVEDGAGTARNTVLKLGQRVQVEQDASGRAVKVTVGAAVVGKVGSVSAAAQTLVVAAQRVAVNTDATLGPVTHFGGGYASLADMAANDLVEVHGSAVYDGGSYLLKATRIEKLASFTEYKVTGTVAGLASGSFQLNGLTVTYGAGVVKPTGATLANGTAVAVFGTALSGTTLTATAVRVLHNQSNVPAANTRVQIGGVVASYDAAAGSLTIDGQTVLVSGATLRPTGVALRPGQYVDIAATVGSGGTLTAQSVTVRNAAGDAAQATIRLAGPIADFVDNASFVVRSVPVDASALNVAAKCPGVTLADGIDVQVTAKAQSGTPVVLATDLACKPAAGVRIVGVAGTASAVNATARTLTVTSAGGTATSVAWTDQTAFVGVTAPTAASDTLAGRTLRVEGTVSGTTLIARAIRLDGTLDGDRFKREGSGGNATWQQYRASLRR